MRRLGAADLAACAAAGVAQVEVVRRPRVAVITTGDELVDVTTGAPRARRDPRLERGAAARVRAHVRRRGRHSRCACADDEERDRGRGARRARRERRRHRERRLVRGTRRLHRARVRALRRGRRARRRDPARTPARARGARESGGVPLLGIPGYPVSAAICAELFLRPLLERLGRRDAPEPREIEVELTRKLFSPLGEDEYVRAVAARVDGRLVATPLRRGAGVITSLSRANVLITIPRFSEGARARRAPHRARAAPARADRAHAARRRQPRRRARPARRAGSPPTESSWCRRTSAASPGWSRCASAPRTWRGRTCSIRRPARTTTPRCGATGRPSRSRWCASREREQGLLVARGNPLGIASLADVVADARALRQPPARRRDAHPARRAARARADRAGRDRRLRAPRVLAPRRRAARRERQRRRRARDSRRRARVRPGLRLGRVGAVRPRACPRRCSTSRASRG